MERCKTCKHWEKHPRAFMYPNSELIDFKGGFCESEKLIEGDYGLALDSLSYSYEEGGQFWTGPEFGCVHHQPKDE